MERFVARQPIFDRNQRIFAYELLFRSGLENYFQCDEPDRATSRVVVDSYLVLGMEVLTGGRRAFINVTRNFIVNQYATLLPKEQAVVEILESVAPDAQVVSACRNLKRTGYKIALDDFEDTENVEPLIQFADYIKVDFRATPSWVRRNLAQSYSARGITMLAEKVESQEEFREAMEIGYSHFQGYFFCKPDIMSGKEIPAFKLNYLMLMREINHDEPQIARIEQILKQESSLCYKLLKYLNSAAFGFAGEITTIHHALSLLGLAEVRKWVCLVALGGMGEDKPKELIVNSVLRAKFCENLANKIGAQSRSAELFLMGLLSMMDAILERPLSYILEELRVSKDVKTALLKGGNFFRYVYELVLAYEKGDWKRTSELASYLRASETAVTQSYLDAAGWVHRIFQADAAI